MDRSTLLLQTSSNVNGHHCRKDHQTGNELNKCRFHVSIVTSVLGQFNGFQYFLRVVLSFKDLCTKTQVRTVSKSTKSYRSQKTLEKVWGRVGGVVMGLASCLRERRWEREKVGEREALVFFV